MRPAPSSRLSLWLVVTAVLLMGLAVVLVGLPQVAVSAGTGVAVPGVLANLPGSAPAVQANGWVVGTDSADGYGVILHTTNDGQLWVRQGSTSDVPNVELNNVKAVDRDAAWVVGNADSGYGVILRTTDAGLTWVRQGGPGMVPDGAIFGVGPVDRETAWVVGQAGTILRTDDGGRTWTQQASGTTADLYEVSAVDGQTAWIIGDRDNGYAIVLHTTNGGQTWERQGTAATLGAAGFIDLTVVDSQTAWAVGAQNYVVKTTDGGVSWRAQMGPGLSDNNGACAVDRNTAWIATDYNTVYRTTDGGTTWNRQDLSLPGDFYLLGVSALGQGTAWVVGGAVFPAKGGIILHTTDAGTTWQIQSTPVDVTFRRASFVAPPPVTSVTGVPNGWVRHAVTLRFSATAVAGSAPVAYSEYCLGGGAWMHGAKVTIHRQGVTKVAYRSADTEGSVGGTRSCTVRIDGVPPTVLDIGSPVAWRGRTACFAYRLSDPAVTSLRARLVITRYGKRVASVDLGMRPTGRKLVTALQRTWRTSRYQWRVIATDPTGHRTVGAAHTLRVLPNHDRR